jgi:hypothetical protein
MTTLIAAVLQRTCYSASGSRRTTDGIHAELQMGLTVKYFPSNNFPRCVIKRNNTANNTLISVFVPTLQVPEILGFFLVDPCISYCTFRTDLVLGTQLDMRRPCGADSHVGHGDGEERNR